MKTKKIKGLMAAPFTPMHSDGRLKLSVIAQYYEMLLQNNVTGAFICGSTGEGVSLTMDEKKAVAEAWASCNQSNPTFTIMTLLGGTCLADCITLANHARDVGLNAVSFTAPFYFKPADVVQLARCCKAVADAVPDMPFYYYHIPVLTGVSFPMIDLLQAVDGLIPNFAGVKYTHEDFMDFLSCLHYGNGKYDMLWGRDENMLPALALGTQGAVGSTFNYAAPLYHALIDAYHGGDLQAAQQWQQKSIDMIRLLGKYGGIATGKAYMKYMGLDCGQFRLPVTNMSEEMYHHFTQDADQIDFHSFSSQLPASEKA